MDRNVLRWIYFVLAFIQAAFTSGIIFGFVDLQKIFISERIYEDHCAASDKEVPCKAQKLFFDRLFTIGSFSNNFAPLFTGAFCDKFGPKITNLTGAAIFFLGCGLFMIKEPAWYMVAYALLGFSGPGVYVSIMHLNNLFPGNQAKVLSFFSGTFTVSTFIFKVFRVLYDDNSWFSMEHLFICYIILLLPFFIVGGFLWPNEPFTLEPSMSDEEKKDMQPLLADNVHQQKTLFGANLKSQLLAPELWLIVMWMAASNLHISYFLGTMSDQVSGSEASAFAWIWNFGFVAIPFFGFLVDHKGIIAGILFCNIGLWLFAIIDAVPYNSIQYVGFVLVSFTNVGIWGIFYTFLSKTFGFNNYGKLLGVSAATIATIGLLQYPLEAATLGIFNGNYIYVNLFFVIITTLVFFTPLFLWLRQRGLAEAVRISTN